MGKPVIKPKKSLVKPIAKMVKLEENADKRIVKKMKKETRGKLGDPRSS